MGNPEKPTALGTGYITKTNKTKQNKNIEIKKDKQHETLQRPG